MPEFRGSALPLSAEGLDAACGVLGVGAAEIWTVLAVETHGFGFLQDRRPLILFERHIFSRLSNRLFDDTHPEISARKAGGYLGGVREYDRLSAAIGLDRESALQSASWGIGQIMGYNCEPAGFASCEEMVEQVTATEDSQLSAMANFVRAEGLHKPLGKHDWAGFARGYNGAAFQKNQYDTRLAGAFEKFRVGPLPDVKIRQAQAYLTFLRIDPNGVDGVMGKRTRSAVVLFREQNGLGAVERVDNGMLEALRDKVAALG